MKPELLLELDQRLVRDRSRLMTAKTVTALVALATIPVFAGVLLVTRYSSVASLTATAFAAVLIVVGVVLFQLPVLYAAYAIAAAALIWLFHLDNIQRLLAGTERRIEFGRGQCCGVRLFEEAAESLVFVQQGLDTFAQGEIVKPRTRLVHFHAEREVRVVIKIGAGADDPVDVAGLDERHQARDAQSRRRERAGER